MSAGSGDASRASVEIRDAGRAFGATKATAMEPVTLGKEQQLQQWQFGAH